MTDAFAPSDPPQLGFFTVTCLPDWVNVPFQPLVTCWFPAKSHSSVQLLSASPRLVTFTLAVKPEPQSLVV